MVPVRGGAEEGRAGQAGSGSLPPLPISGAVSLFTEGPPWAAGWWGAEGPWAAPARPSAAWASWRPGARGALLRPSAAARPPTHLAWDGAGLASPSRPAPGAVMTELETQTRSPARLAESGRQTRDERRGDERRGSEARPPQELAAGRWPGRERRPGARLHLPLSRLHPHLWPLIAGHYHVVGTPLECAVSSPHSWGAGPRGGGPGGVVAAVGRSWGVNWEAQGLGFGSRLRPALKDTGWSPSADKG